MHDGEPAVPFPHNLYPVCTAALPVPTPANCFSAPAHRSFLQILPTPAFHHFADHHIEATAEHLPPIASSPRQRIPRSVLFDDSGTKTAQQSALPAAYHRRQGVSPGL